MREDLKKHNQLKIINAFKTNNEVVLKEFYNANYYKIEFFVMSNNGSKDEAKDIYQEAFLAVWKNLKLDKFIPQSESSLSGYLYTIAKNKWMDYLRSSTYKKTKLIEDNNLSVADNNEEFYDEHQDKKLKSTMEAFKNLGQPCKQLLSTFYFEKKSLSDIASELHIKETSVRNKKYRCMEKLRAIVLASNL